MWNPHDKRDCGVFREFSWDASGEARSEDYITNKELINAMEDTTKISKQELTNRANIASIAPSPSDDL